MQSRKVYGRTSCLPNTYLYQKQLRYCILIQLSFHSVDGLRHLADVALKNRLKQAKVNGPSLIEGIHRRLRGYIPSIHEATQSFDNTLEFTALIALN